jgi:hypothetical protein
MTPDGLTPFQWFIYVLGAGLFGYLSGRALFFVILLLNERRKR